MAVKEELWEGLLTPHQNVTAPGEAGYPGTSRTANIQSNSVVPVSTALGSQNSFFSRSMRRIEETQGKNKILHLPAARMI